MNPMDSPAFVEAAARATINERCASSFLHDVRGSMQALFSALDLLGRAARAGSVNPSRVEKACELARRAIDHHEKSTLDVLQMLTLQHENPTAVDFSALLHEVVHFLRNESASRSLVVRLSGADVTHTILVQRAKFQTLLIGLLTAAFDETPTAGTVELRLGDAGHRCVLVMEWHPDDGHDPGRTRELTVKFAEHFLTENGGSLTMERHEATGSRLVLSHPQSLKPPQPPADAV